MRRRKDVQGPELTGVFWYGGGFRLHDSGRLGSGCNPTSLLVSIPPCTHPPPPGNYLAHPQGAGMHVRGQASIRSKRVGKNDVTHEEAQCIRLSMRLGYRDAHEYAAFFHER